MGHFDTPWTEQQSLLEVDHNAWHNEASNVLRVTDLEANHVSMRKFNGAGVAGLIRYKDVIPGPVTMTPVTDFSGVGNNYYFLDWSVGTLDVFDAGARLYSGQPVSNVYWGGVTFPANTSFHLEKGVWYWNIAYNFTGEGAADTLIQGYVDYVCDYSAQVPSLPPYTSFENYYHIIFDSNDVALPLSAPGSSSFAGAAHSGIILSTSDTECFVAPQFLVWGGSEQAISLRNIGIRFQRIVRGV